jgi:hypothetical protein
MTLPTWAAAMVDDEIAARAVGKLTERRPDVVALARVASVAAIVEPALLRRLRLEVPGLAPKGWSLDAGVEADLWFSRLAHVATAGQLTLRPAVAEILRHQLGEPQHSAVGRAARKIVVDAHRKHPDMVQLEERIIWSTIIGDADDVGRAFDRVLATIRLGPDRAAEVVRWAMQARRRLPASALNTPAGRKVLAAVAMHVERIIPAQLLTADRFPDSVGDVAPTGLPVTTVAVELAEGGIRFVASDQPNAATLTVPDTRPLVMEARWTGEDGAEHSAVILAEPGSATALDGLAGRVVLRTIAGRRFRVDSTASEQVMPDEQGAHPVTITIDSGRPGPVVPDDFAGLSFERGPLTDGNAGVVGNLFSPTNKSLIGLFRNLGLRSLRIGGGTVDQLIPAGTGSDGFTGIDNLFAFAAAAGVKVIYTLRLLSPGAQPIGDLQAVHAQAAGHIWRHYRQNVASFAIGNEPDWHAYHTYPGHPLDPAIYEEVSGVPGSAYQSYLTQWRGIAEAIAGAAPGAPMSGPDTGAYSALTYAPDPDSGASWTERFALDERDSGRVAKVTQHYYVGGSPGNTTAQQAISNMLSPEWVSETAIGTQPTATTYTPYPWLYEHNLAPVAAAGLRYRLTESNDYLGGVPGASNAFASALWALDHLHWWAAHGAAGVNFHNKQWLYTATIVPDPADGRGYVINPKGYGIKTFTLGSAGQVKPTQIQNPDGINVTAYCVGAEGADYVTVINKTHGADAGDAAVTIVPPGPGVREAQVMILAGGQSGDASGTRATLGGATITGDIPWDGKWSALPADPHAGVTVTVRATTAAIVRIRSRA